MVEIGWHGINSSCRFLRRRRVVVVSGLCLFANLRMIIFFCSQQSGRVEGMEITSCGFVAPAGARGASHVPRASDAEHTLGRGRGGVSTSSSRDELLGHATGRRGGVLGAVFGVY